MNLILKKKDADILVSMITLEISLSNTLPDVDSILLIFNKLKEK